MTLFELENMIFIMRSNRMLCDPKEVRVCRQTSIQNILYTRSGWAWMRIGPKKTSLSFTVPVQQWYHVEMHFILWLLALWDLNKSSTPHIIWLHSLLSCTCSDICGEDICFSYQRAKIHESRSKMKNFKLDCQIQRMIIRWSIGLS